MSSGSPPQPPLGPGSALPPIPETTPTGHTHQPYPHRQGESSGSKTHTHHSLAEAIGYQGYLHADPVRQEAAASYADAAAAMSVASPPLTDSHASVSPSEALVLHTIDESGPMPPQRQIARKALLAAADRATSIITAQKQSSGVLAFGVNTTVRVVNAITPNTALNMARSQWDNYGDPLLSAVDRRLDEAINVVEITRMRAAGAAAGATSALYAGINLPSSSSDGSRSDSPLHNDDRDRDGSDDTRLTLHDEQALYWQQLKSKFVQSRWYSKVDQILLQNRVVEAFSTHMVRPAESFYSTVTEEFLSSSSLDEFMAGLKARVGPAWDERLTPLSKVFYTTAKAVTGVVGAGRFVGGALQLGRASVHNAIDQLLHQWERVLGTGDEYLDRWLPEREEQQAVMPGSNTGTQLVAMSDTTSSAAADASLPVSTPSSVASTTRSLKKRSASALDDESEENSPEAFKDSTAADCNGLNALADASAMLDASHSQATTTNGTTSSAAPFPTPISSSTPPSPATVSELSYKVQKRLRQRLPSLPSLSVNNPTSLVQGWSDHVRNSLVRERWFPAVDAILLQNSFVQALAAIVQPAEHFFSTAMRVFDTSIVRKKQHVAAIAAAQAAQDAAQQAATAGDATMDDTLASSAASTSSSSSNSSSSSPSAPLLPLDSPLVGEFVVSLKQVLGASWDDRLQEHARAFFHTAWNAVVTQEHKSSAETAAAAAS